MYIYSHSFPDVMMESYKNKPLAPLFFIIFLIFGLYIITNVLLAMIYSTFQKIQKEKFKKLYLHRRYIYIVHTYIIMHSSVCTILFLVKYVCMLHCVGCFP